MYSFDQKMHDLNIVLGAGDTVIKKKQNLPSLNLHSNLLTAVHQPCLFLAGVRCYM